jgi:hypothetical protein
MCWNKDVSIRAFLFGVLSAAIAVSRGFPKRHVAFYMVFTTIQLMEYFLWTYFDDAEKNSKWSARTLLVITCIPIFATLTIEDAEIRKKAFVAAVVFFGLIWLWKRDSITYKTGLGSDGHLAYEFIPPTMLYSIGWFGFFFGSILFLNKDNVLKIFTVLSALFSLLIVRRGNTYNSYWCFTAVFIWLTVLARVAKTTTTTIV